MSKIKAFGYIYYRSLTSTRYYAEILKTKLQFSLKYFFTLGLVASLIYTVAISIRMIPRIQMGLEAAITQTKGIYPEDLVISTDGANWSINREEPYMLSLPVDPKTWVPEGESGKEVYFPQNLVVFDHNGTIEDLEKFDAIAMINSTNVLIRDANGVQGYPLGELPQGEFTRETFDNVLDTLAGLSKYIPSLVVSFVFLGSLVSYLLFRAIYLLIVGVVLWVTGQIANNKLDFSSAYRVGLHSMTLPVTVQVILTVINVPFFVPMWFFVVNAIFGIFVVFSMNKSGTETAEAKPDMGE